MTGHALELEGRDLTYFSAGQSLEEAERQAVGYDRSDDAFLQQHARARRVLGALIRPTPRLFQVLHWSDGRDLTKLDELVGSGRVRDADFDAALLTEARTVVCRECSAQIRMLVVDTGQVLFHRTLAERLRQHVLVTECPRCGEPWTVQAVEVIE